MQLICVNCGVLATTEQEIEQQDICPKCQTKVVLPTVFDCARFGLLPELKELIDQDPHFDINAVESSTQATLLHIAASNRAKLAIILYLMNTCPHKSNINIEARDGIHNTTPLYWAVENNSIYAVELLLSHGADLHTMDRKTGFNCFLKAVQKNFPILAAYLVAKGIDVNTRVDDNINQTALMLLCNGTSFHLDSFRMLLSLKAEINAQDANGNTALHYAARYNVPRACQMLLQVYARTDIKNYEKIIDSENKEQKTPLDIARARLHPKTITRHLLEDDYKLDSLAKKVGLVTKTQLEQHLYKLSFLVPWIWLPMTAIIATYTPGLFSMVLGETLLTTLCIIFLQFVQVGAYGDKRKAAAMMFGVNVASIFWLVIPFPYVVNKSPLFMAIFAVSSSLILLCLYKTATRDAGVVSTTYTEKLRNITVLVEKKSRSETKLCLTCLHKRPLRGKHCAELNACIARFDHYCPFVVNAVGDQNHAWFFGFLFFAVTSIAMGIYAYIEILYADSRLYWHSDTNLLLTWNIFPFLWSVGHFRPLETCMLALSVLHIVWIGYMLGFNIYLVLMDLTTNEIVKNENLERAYSRGLVKNTVDFFCTPWEKRVDWRVMYQLQEYKDLVNQHESISDKKVT